MLCGRCPLYFLRHCSITTCAFIRLPYSSAFKHFFLKVPLKLSLLTCMKSCNSFATSSLPLSLHTALGRPWVVFSPGCRGVVAHDVCDQRIFQMHGVGPKQLTDITRYLPLIRVVFMLNMPVSATK